MKNLITAATLAAGLLAGCNGEPENSKPNTSKKPDVTVPAPVENPLPITVTVVPKSDKPQEQTPEYKPETAQQEYTPIQVPLKRFDRLPTPYVPPTEPTLQDPLIRKILSFESQILPENVPGRVEKPESFLPRLSLDSEASEYLPKELTKPLQEEAPQDPEQTRLKNEALSGVSSAGSSVYGKAIAGVNVFRSDKTDRMNYQGKGMLDLGDVTVFLQGNMSDLESKLGNGVEVEGNVDRVEAGLDVYFDVFKGGKLLTRISLGNENSEYTFTDLLGNALEMNTESDVYTVEAALGESGLENNDYHGVTKNFNFIRGRFARREGTVKGDIKGDYSATNADITGHLKVGGPWTVDGGVALFDEDRAGLNQRIIASELGLGYHGGIGYLRAKAIGQLLRETDETVTGGKLEAGIRVLRLDVDGGNVVNIDLTGQAGFLRNRDQGTTEDFYGIGVNVYATTKPGK